MNGKNGSTPPITYPEIEICGKVYMMKMALNAVYRLEHYGLKDLAQAIKSLQAAGKDIQLTMKMAACLLGTETKGGLWKPINFPDITLDELPETLTAELLKRYDEVATKVLEAMGKVTPEVAGTAQTPESSGPKPSESEKTDGSKPGPSEPVPAVSG